MIELVNSGCMPTISLVKKYKYDTRATYVKKPSINAKVGDYVAWTSKAGGHAKTKMGLVLAVIPANETFKAHLPAFLNEHKHTTRPLRGVPYVANWKRYLVAVYIGETLHLYMPSVTLLQRTTKKKIKDFYGTC